MNSLTPAQIVNELNRYIIGQNKAKRSVAVALRNRYRRSMLDETLREEVSPKNILMIGPTGVGKTEIARRLAKLVDAPFIKVEATKFTEVGYVGRDVESIIRDLAENAVRMVRAELSHKYRKRAEVLAEDRLLNLLITPPQKKENGLEALLSKFNPQNQNTQAPSSNVSSEQRDTLMQQLKNKELEDREIEIEVEESSPQLEVGGNSISIGDMMGNMMPKQTKIRRVKVSQARKILIQEEISKMIDEDYVKEEAVKRCEQNGIVFIDEIDKIAGKKAANGPDVSREGVQRDILPIVEGSTINTKYGPIRTDFILFIAAGAFHVSKVEDLIPELQGRFPVRVELSSLSVEDFKAILTQPDNALTLQYKSLLQVDNVYINFDDSAIEEIAKVAFIKNENLEDIGARRLYAVFEEVLEDIAYHAGGENMPRVDLLINADYVKQHLSGEFKDSDPRKYII